MKVQRVWLACLCAAVSPIVPSSLCLARSVDQPTPLSPEQSMARMRLPEGFRVSVFAAEPQIERPIALAFDARGRAWVAQRGAPRAIGEPENGASRGKVTICEDTDDDGRADRFHVFATGLNEPTGLVLAGGGLIVACAPDLLLLRDTDGDDVADDRKVLLTGFAQQGSCTGLSSLRYGFDNAIWAALGSSGATVKADADGGLIALTPGVIRFLPDGSKLEQMTTTNANTWGLGFDDSAQVFTTCASPEHTTFLAIPNRHFIAVRGWSGTGCAGIADHAIPAGEIDTNACFPAVMGQTIYTGGAFPADYRNRAAFVCEPARHRVHTDWMVPKGSSFCACDGGALLESDDPHTAPVETIVGPDAALWVVDAYAAGQPAASAGEPASSPAEAGAPPAECSGFGRIYRVTHADGPPAKPPNSPPRRLDKATPEELVAALSHPNLFWRLTAQRLMVEWHRPEVFLPLLADRVRHDLEGPAAQHALLTMSGLGPFPDTVDSWRDSVRMAVYHPAPRVRRAAAAVLPRTREYATYAARSWAMAEADPQVRLAFFLALAEMPRCGAAAEPVMRRLDMAAELDDPWLVPVTIAALAPSSFDALGTFASLRVKPETRPRIIQTVRALAEHYARGCPSLTVGQLITALNVADPDVAVATLQGLRAGWPPGRKPPSGRLEQDFLQLLHKLPTAGKAQTIALASGWGVRGKLPDEVVLIKQGLNAELLKTTLPDSKRIEAARTLVLMTPDRVSTSGVFEFTSTVERPALTGGLIDAFSLCTSIRVGDHTIYRWTQYRHVGLIPQVELLMRRPRWTRSLLDGMEYRLVSPFDPSIDQVQRLINHPEADIAEHARKIFRATKRLPDPDRAKVVAARLPLAAEHGDVTRGQAVFRANCAQCHHCGKHGFAIGPDLARPSKRSKAELLTDILDPNRSVEPRYRLATVVMRDGRIISGLLIEPDDGPIELLDAMGYQRPLAPVDVAEIKRPKRSLMPDGFECMSASDLASLLEFLTQPPVK